MDKMNLPWVLGANDYSLADSNQGDWLVLQLVGVVGTAGNHRLPPAPRSYVSPACFAVVRWNGVTIDRTPCCRDLLSPTWDEQVSCGKRHVRCMLVKCLLTLSMP